MTKKKHTPAIMASTPPQVIFFGYHPRANRLTLPGSQWHLSVQGHCYCLSLLGDSKAWSDKWSDKSMGAKHWSLSFLFSIECVLAAWNSGVNIKTQWWFISCVVDGYKSFQKLTYTISWSPCNQIYFDISVWYNALKYIYIYIIKRNKTTSELGLVFAAL